MVFVFIYSIFAYFFCFLILVIYQNLKRFVFAYNNSNVDEGHIINFLLCPVMFLINFFLIDLYGVIVNLFFYLVLDFLYIYIYINLINGMVN